MKPQPDPKLAVLAQQIADGKYQIDPQAVAEAILRRLADLARRPAIR
jgi:anti-sigma28 factor (negative regulator of flagellin synthesis)